jgi:hypothetical protein
MLNVSMWSSEMRRTMRAALVATACIAIVGCATAPPPPQRSTIAKSYTLNQSTNAAVGSAFFANQDGRIETTREWVGLLFAPGGWKYSERYSTDYVRQELLYGGRSGDTIEVSYREFRGGLAAQAFTQNLRYDLKQSKFIQFQRFQIEVLDANNQTITSKVVRD